MHIIATIGIVASGKSTWAKQFAQEKGFRYISSDEIRAELCGGDAGDQRKNAQVFCVIEKWLMESFKLKETVVYDATCYNESNRKTLEQFVNWGATIEYHYFPISLADAFVRNANRDRVVPENVIKKQFTGLSLPEGRKIVWHNVPEDAANKEVCILCDLDGTLALMNGRNPYDASTCDQDLVNEPVLVVLKAFTNIEFNAPKIIFVSGREDRFRSQTQNFLQNKCRLVKEGHFFSGTSVYRGLFMRNTADNRKDSLVKAEIYHKHIKPFYDVLFVLDDRSQVVKAWRSMGLTCFQVAEGDF